jgi:hypothetical protein
MNEPAFPTAETDGLSIRDYFAAKVMQGFASRDVHDSGLRTPEQRAKLAYIDADAMMEARK